MQLGALEPLIAILVPALSAGCLVGGLALARRRTTNLPPNTFGWEGLALCGGLALSLCLLRGWRGFPPTDINDWPLFLAIPAAILAVFADRGKRTRLLLTLLFVAIATPLALSVRLFGDPSIRWSHGNVLLWPPILGACWIALIIATQVSAQQRTASALAAWAGMLAVAGFVVAEKASDAQHGMLLAGAGVAAGILGCLSLVFRSRINVTSVAVALAAMVPIWWLLAHTLSYNNLLPLSAIVPLALAPIAGAWATWPLRNRPWLSAVVSLVVAVAVAAISLALLPNTSAEITPGW
ncbi:MAG: hypothetical protein AAB263_09695 [Planctomycetota bacterium]